MDPIMTAAEARRRRRNLILMSVGFGVGGFALCAARVAGHRYAPDLFPRVDPHEYSDDMLIRISGILMFWGMVGFVRGLLFDVSAYEPPRESPGLDGSNGGHMALATAKWLQAAAAPAAQPQRAEEASVGGFGRGVAVVLLALFAGVCCLATIGFLNIRLSHISGPITPDGALVGAGVSAVLGLLSVWGVRALWRSDRVSRGTPRDRGAPGGW